MAINIAYMTMWSLSTKVQKKKKKKKKKCKHMDTPTLRGMRSVNNPFRPYFTCRRKEMCKYFQWADEIPVDTYYEREPPVYNPEETAKEEIIQGLNS